VILVDYWEELFVGNTKIELERLPFFKLEKELKKKVDTKYENDLLKKLRRSTGGDYKETLVDLVQLYRRTHKAGKAFEYIHRILYIYESWDGTEHGPFPSELFNLSPGSLRLQG
jgi:hypothetical protein